MHRKAVILLSALAAVFFAAFTWVLLQPQDPLFRGKPESEWIKGIAYPMGLTDSQNREQVERWREFGPEGLRVLQRVLDRPPPGRAYRNFYLRLSKILPYSIMRVLPDPKPRISGGPRHCVVYLLGQLRNDAWPAWRSVARMLSDEDDFVRQSAVCFFTENDGTFLNQKPQEKKELLPLFIKILENTNTNWGLRNNAALALRYYSDHPSIAAPALTQALQDSAPAVRLLAAEGLHRVDAEAAKTAGAVKVLIQLTRHSDDQIASRAVSALRVYQNEAQLAVPALLEALRATNTLVACSAVWALEHDFPKQANLIIPEMKKAAERQDNAGGYARNALKHLESETEK